MKKTLNYNGLKMVTLIALRMLIGWHILYEGIVKLLSPGWSSASFLGESQWILSSFSNWIISKPDVLRLVDFLNKWGLTAIGGKYVDMVYLHIKEWIDCIRSGELSSANIERAFEEGVAGLMAHISHVDKRRVEWDPINKKIV